MEMLLSTMTDLVSTVDDEESRSCPIQMEEFDKAGLDFLPPGTCFVDGRPDLCVGSLPCGHRFSPMAIVYHMCISGMQCPVCRSGSKALLRYASVPQHLRRVFQVRSIRQQHALLYPLSEP